MEADFLSLLADENSVASLVTTGSITRIAWNSIGQSWADPNVVIYRVAGGVPGYTMDGPDGLVSTVVQINIRAVKYSDMIALRDAIAALLSGYTGTKGDTEFLGIFHRSERQVIEKPGDVLYQTCQLDFDVWSRAAASS